MQLSLSEMERRSWPWKRKSSDKAAAEKAAAEKAAVEKAAAVLDSAGASPPRPKSQSDQVGLDMNILFKK